MLHNNFEIRVLVKGRPITEYAHNGQVFLEGRHGSNFEVEFLNRSSTRVEAVISVDGLSVIDGKEAGINSSGYVIDAHSSVRIPGWKLNDEQVAAFVFAGKSKSYATQSSGSDRNNGVIGALVFAEKASLYTASYGGGSVAANPFYSAHGGSIGNGLLSMQPRTKGIIRNSMSASSEQKTKGAPIGRGGASIMSMSSTTLAAPSGAYASLAPAVDQNLGTGFGAATEFGTTTVSFSRGNLEAMIVMYYDDAKSLKMRGIDIVKPSRQRITNTPNAFPGMNCVPPSDWKG